MEVYFSGLTAMIDAYGQERFAALSGAHRKTVYGSVLSGAPLDAATASLATAAFAIPLLDIFSEDSPVHKKWQFFHKAVFCQTCDIVYTHRIKDGDTRRLQCYRT